jgi:hypothetical protein
MIQAHQLTKRYGDKTAVHTLSMFTLIIFHFALGWKVYSLSRNTAGSPEDREYTGNGVRAEGDSNPSKYLDAVQQGR